MGRSEGTWWLTGEHRKNGDIVMEKHKDEKDMVSDGREG